MKKQLLLFLQVLLTLNGVCGNLPDFFRLQQDTSKKRNLLLDSTIYLNRDSQNRLDTTKIIYTSWGNDGETLNYIIYRKKQGNWIPELRNEKEYQTDVFSVTIKSTWDTVKSAFIYAEKETVELDTVSPSVTSNYIYDTLSAAWKLTEFTQQHFRSQNQPSDFYKIRSDQTTGQNDTIEKRVCTFSDSSKTCISSTWISDEKSWLLIEKATEGINSEGMSFIEILNYDPTEKKWKGYYRKDELKITDVLYKEANYTWDEEKNTWIGSYKFSNHTDTTDNIFENIDYRWSKGKSEWIYDRKSFRKLDQNDSPVYDAVYSYDTIRSVWIGINLTEWETDSHGEYIVETSSVWDTINMKWKYNNKTETIRDTYGNITGSRSYTWINGTWEKTDEGKIELTLNSKGKILTQIFFSRDEFNNQNLHLKNEYQYNSKDQIVKINGYYYRKDSSQWMPSTRAEFNFDNAGNQNFIKKYTYDESTASWIGSEFWETISDSSEGSKIYKKYQWDYIKNDWKYTRIDTVIENPVLKYYAYYSWDDFSNAFTGNQRHIITANAQGRTTGVTQFQWDYPSGKWKKVTNNNTEYYDTTGLVTKHINYNWIYPENFYGISYQIQNFYSEHEIVTGISDEDIPAVINNLRTINIYPNPSDDMINIAGEGILYHTITDISGQLIGRYSTDNINISELNSGIYFITTYTTEGISLTNRFIKK